MGEDYFNTTTNGWNIDYLGTMISGNWETATGSCWISVNHLDMDNIKIGICITDENGNVTILPEGSEEYSEY